MAVSARPAWASQSWCESRGFSDGGLGSPNPLELVWELTAPPWDPGPGDFSQAADHSREKGGGLRRVCGHPALVRAWRPLQRFRWCPHWCLCCSLATSIEYLWVPGEGARLGVSSPSRGYDWTAGPGVSHPSPQIHRRLQHEAQRNSTFLPAE